VGGAELVLPHLGVPAEHVPGLGSGGHGLCWPERGGHDEMVVWTLLVMNLAVAGFFQGRSHWPQAGSDQNGADERGTPQPGVVCLRPHEDVRRSGVVAAEVLCVEWRGLNLVEFAQVREQLRYGWRAGMSFTEVPLNTGIGDISALPSPQSATTKLSELAAAACRMPLW